MTMQEYISRASVSVKFKRVVHCRNWTFCVGDFIITVGELDLIQMNGELLQSRGAKLFYLNGVYVIPCN